MGRHVTPFNFIEFGRQLLHSNFFLCGVDFTKKISLRQRYSKIEIQSPNVLKLISRKICTFHTDSSQQLELSFVLCQASPPLHLF